MELSTAQVAFFKKHGYLAVSSFFNDQEVLAFQAEVARLQANGKLRNVATEGDGKTMASTVKNLQLCPMFNESDLFRAVPFAPKVKAAITQLIGDPFIKHLDQIFLKPGNGEGMGTNWHQDNAYFQIADPLRGTAMWVAAHEATLANGTMQIVPDAFREKLEHTRDPMSDHHIRCFPDESRAIPVELPAGGVLFFCYGTPHCTKNNFTDKARAGLAFHFLHEDFAAKSLIEDGRNDRPYVTGPKSTGGQSEYGVKVDGTWDSEVEKASG